MARRARTGSASPSSAYKFITALAFVSVFIIMLCSRMIMIPCPSIYCAAVVCFIKQVNNTAFIPYTWSMVGTVICLICPTNCVGWRILKFQNCCSAGFVIPIWWGQFCKVIIIEANIQSGILSNSNCICPAWRRGWPWCLFLYTAITKLTFKIGLNYICNSRYICQMVIRLSWEITGVAGGASTKSISIAVLVWHGRRIPRVQRAILQSIAC